VRSIVFKRRRFATLSVAVAIYVSLTATQAADEKPQPQNDVRVHSDVYTPIIAISKNLPEYPYEARSEAAEGWVNVSFMVSPNGTPYEIYVSESTGNKELERAALDAVKAWRFKPASINGQPIDSATSAKLRFVLKGDKIRATPEFASAYRALGKAIDDDDRAAAEAALAKLHVSNLYEDAFLGFAQYRFALRWGTQEQQIRGLRRAIAEETDGYHLPKAEFVAALRSLLPLELNARDFANAMSTWEKLQKIGVDSSLRPLMEKVQELRTSDQAYGVIGQIGESSAWSYKLFKKHFQITVSAGHVSQVKLHCARKFASFAFDPGLQYQIDDRYGDCEIFVEGDPGTRFELVQL
jgi:TonB family protein